MLLLVLPVPAFAATEEAGWGWIETIGRWFNLALLFGVLFYFVREPMKRFFQQRQQRIAEEIVAAQTARAESDRRLTEIEQRMSRLDIEVQSIRAEAREQAEREKSRIIQQADEEARKIVAAAEREISGLTRAAEQSLREHVAELSVRLAGERIRREMDAETERRLIDRFFGELAGTGK